MTIKSTALIRSKFSDTLQQRFEANCSKPDENGCIHWLGTRTPGGYGLIRPYPKFRTTAHRVAWVLKRGDLAPEILVLHKCDTPSCVNVDHLFVDLAKANTHDMIAKGRHGWRNGTPWQKLNATDGEQICDLRRAGCTQQQIADWMFVSRPLISLILGGTFNIQRL